MTLNRRDFVRLSLCSSVFGSSVLATAPQLLAQGVAAHTVKPVARPAPSGRPFYAHFVDVAASAGLQAPVVYGGVESKKYILEATGCGCAFLDYGNKALHLPKLQIKKKMAPSSWWQPCESQRYLQHVDSPDYLLAVGRMPCR